MKKIILLLSVVTLVFTSCKNDDDSTSQDQFIGTWTYYKSFTNGVEEVLSDCDKQDKIQVNSDGTLTDTYYYDNNGTCELDGEDSATWENLGNGIYLITYNVDDFYEDKITFENNTFFIEYVEDSNTYKDVYIRN